MQNGYVHKKQRLEIGSCSCRSSIFRYQLWPNKEISQLNTNILTHLKLSLLRKSWNFQVLNLLSVQLYMKMIYRSSQNLYLSWTLQEKCWEIFQKSSIYIFINQMKSGFCHFLTGWPLRMWPTDFEKFCLISIVEIFFPDLTYSWKPSHFRLNYRNQTYKS